MYSEKSISRIEIIEKKIHFINNIVKEKESIINALEDEQMRVVKYPPER